jgi:hypothetical protein
MQRSRSIRNRKSDGGVALLISIFVLLLICVVAIALIVASGTETALSGNYRSATSVYYAALAGLEETRGRLLTTNPNYFLNTDPNFMPNPGGVLPIGQVRYVIHQLPGETVTPWDSSNPAGYPDTEYASEFPTYPMPTSSPDLDTIVSVSTIGGYEGPLFKWVRITAVTEFSIGVDINSSSGPLSQNTPLYFDSTNGNLTHSTSGTQALALTALAVLPNGSTKMLQYIVAAPKALSFGAAITLAGVASPGLPSMSPPNKVAFDYPTPGPFYVDGRDHDCNGNVVFANPTVYGLGWTSSPITWGSNSGPPPSANYTGTGGAPSIANDSAGMSAEFLTATSMQTLVTKFYNDSDTVRVPTNPFPSTSATHPKTIVVSGDLDLSGSSTTGYGILIVTGNFLYSPSTTWNGIVLVLGQGYAHEGHGSGGGQFNGAVVIANILGGNLGPSSIDFNDPAGSSFYYSTCWINTVLPPPGYTVLSFHEITQ